jgi:hypothetical protein
MLCQGSRCCAKPAAGSCPSHFVGRLSTIHLKSPWLSCRGVFTDDYKKTIGVDFLEKQLYVPAIGQDVQLYLWDTAGQEEFDSITKTYYRGEHRQR